MSDGPIHIMLVYRECMNKSDESLYSGRQRLATTSSTSTLAPGMNPHLSASNPDLSSLTVDDIKQEMPDHVVKVYRADQSFKFLPIHKVGVFTHSRHKCTCMACKVDRFWFGLNNYHQVSLKILVFLFCAHEFKCQANMCI